MQLNPGKVYKNLEERDPERKKYGLIPKMAAGSKGCIGSLLAASFCEQVNSVAKDIMTDAHLLMGNESLKMMGVLRINRPIMEYMQEKYKDLPKQQFRQTVVQPPSD